MKDYFADCHCVEDIKKVYKRLAIRFHPDHGGDLREMQDLNSAYEAAFKLWGSTRRSPKSPTEYYHADTEETAADFIGIISKLLNLEGVTVELCGRWLWVTGDTRKHADALKAAGCRWSPKKCAWSWHFPEDGHRGRGNWSLTRIRNTYGSMAFDRAENNALATA